MRNLVPRAIALADVLAIACYIVDVSPILGQAFGLALKLLLLPVMVRKGSILFAQGPMLLSLAGLCLLSLALGSTTEWRDVVSVLGFLTHLTLTLLLKREELPAYLRTVAMLITGSALLYTAMVLAGQIPTHWGRFWYFNGFHSNLGAELTVAAILCGVISLRYWPFMITAAVLLSNTVLMQGRSAMLTILMCAVLRSLHEAFVSTDQSRVQLRIILLTPIAMVVAMLALPSIAEALLLDDANRGVGTGFVGRTDLWRIAWDAFLDRPLFGQGLGWFERTQEHGAHNFFLYGLAEMGLMSLILFAMLSYMAIVAYRQHGWKIVNLSPVIIMFMMNDRFINLNPYPFMIWVLVFALSARSYYATQRGPARGPAPALPPRAAA